MIVYEFLLLGLVLEFFVVNGLLGEIRMKFFFRDVNYLIIDLLIIVLDRGILFLNNIFIL